jgi:hypothetical protein
MKKVMNVLIGALVALFVVMLALPVLAQEPGAEPGGGIKLDALTIVNLILFVAGAVAFTYLGIAKGKLEDLRNLLSAIVEALKDNTITKEEAELIKQAARKLIGKS